MLTVLARELGCLHVHRCSILQNGEFNSVRRCRIRTNRRSLRKPASNLHDCTTPAEDNRTPFPPPLRGSLSGRRLGCLGDFGLGLCLGFELLGQLPLLYQNTMREEAGLQAEPCKVLLCLVMRGFEPQETQHRGPASASTSSLSYRSLNSSLDYLRT